MKVCNFKVHRIMMLIAMISFYSLSLSLTASSAHGVTSCGGVSDDCYCGDTNPYPCYPECPNNSNCTWWAWHNACCGWGLAIPVWGNAQDWIAAAYDNDFELLENPVIGSIGVNTTSGEGLCEKNDKPVDCGHVAWITGVDGEFVDTTEMACYVSKSGFWQKRRLASDFDGGFIVAKNPNSCQPEIGSLEDGTDPILTIKIREQWNYHKDQNHNLGCPINNGSGTRFVHDIFGVLIQDYYQPDPGQWYSGTDDGKTAILYNVIKNDPYLLRSGFWGTYKCLKYEDDYNSSMGGATLLGAPKSNEYIYPFEGSACSQSTSGSTVQQFEKGCMWWDGQIHVHLDQPPYNFDIDRAKEDCPNTLDILPNPWPESCDSSDMCLNMGCSLHEEPLDGSRFKTPSTGSGVYYGRSGYKHPFPTSDCYHLLYEDFHGTLCIADEIAEEMDDAPEVCSHGSFIRVSGDSSIYRLENGNLRALCGNWTSSSFLARWGYPFQIALLTDQQHFEEYIQEYPISTSGIYAPGESAPKCDDPGYECGEHYDIDKYCWGYLNCGECATGKECISGYCVSTGPYCGDGNCDDNDGETCLNCEDDCGPCMELIPGYITSPDDGATVDNREFDIYWENGYASDGSATKTAILCSINGGEWEYRGYYGYIPPYSHAWHNPGDLIECKVRTRLDSDYTVWVDSSITYWVAGTDYPNIVVKSLTLRDNPIANGCNDLYLDATFENVGNREGDWKGLAYLHPYGEAYTSANAVKARFDHVLYLQPGGTLTQEFRIDADVTIPLSIGTWQVTAVAEDTYEGYADPNTLTIDIQGYDSTPPDITLFTLYAFEGDPMEVVPGKEYYVRANATDNYHIDNWVLDWRVQNGSWQSINLTYYPDRVCNTSDATNGYWSIPAEFVEDKLLELRFTVWDLAGLTDTAVINVKTRSHNEPSLAFVKPQGGEEYIRQTSSDNPHCIPVEAYFTPGESLKAISVGFYDPNQDRTYSKLTLGVDDIPADGHIDECITTSEAGDNIIMYIRLYDVNNENFYYYANPVTVNYAPSPAPWHPMVVDQSQSPLPRPDYGTAQSTMSFSGFSVNNGQISMYRKDSRWWLEGYSTKYSELAISNLTFSYDDLQFISYSQVLPTVQESGDYNRPDDILDIKLQRDDDIFASKYDVVIEGSCENENDEHCDYEFYVREIENNTVYSAEQIGQYLDREWFEAPSPDPMFWSPLNKTILPVRHSYNGIYSTDVYRKTDQWTLLNTYSPSFRHVWTDIDGLHAIQKITNAENDIEWHDLIIDETSGVILSDTIIFSDIEVFNTNNLAEDPEHETTYLMVWNYDNDHLRLFKYAEGEWTDIYDKYFGSTWQGYTISNLWPQSLMARNGHLYFFTQLQCDDSYGTHELAVHFMENEEIDLESGFEETPYSSFIVIDGDGYLFRQVPFYCEWNFEEKLCLQKSYPTFTNCYDADPCTEDIWNPETGQCEHPTIQCEQDGNACNGPEVCESTTGNCITDSEQAVICDDNNPCNGVESCIEETGECSVSDVPEIDDGYSCTLDECDEETGDVSNTPQDDQCVTDACHSAVCDPSNNAADQDTGCVLSELAIEPDNLDCTDDSCDPITGDPVYELNDGNCLIDRVCYSNQVPNPVNSCKVCDSSNPNQWSNIQNGTDCEDGEYCTVNDSCISGVCIGSARDCSGEATDVKCQSASCDEQQNTCTVSNFQDGTSCADFNVCNGEETCQSGACIAGTALDCGDGHDCTTDNCNAENGCFSTVDNGNCLIDNQCYVDGATPNGESCRVCLSSAFKTDWTNLPDTIPCNDGNLCTYTDRCDGSGGCGGTEITCTDDPEICGANRICDGSSACAVSYPGTETFCDDDELCTYNDICDGTGNCAGTEITCNDDAEVCGADRVCNGSDSCTITYPGSETSCDDDDLCTYSDQCSGDGACTGTKIVCTDDDTVCGANRFCNGTDECNVTYPENSTTCDDEELCTYDDHCNGSGSCIGTEIACTNDPSVCGTNRSCNGTNQCEVSYPDSSIACNADNNGCTDDDHCNGSGLCVAGTEISCGHLDDECNTGICVSENAGTASCKKDPSDHFGNNCGEAPSDCSGQGTCDEYGICQSNDYEEGTACNYEDNPCLVQDSCDGSGVCSDNGTLEDGTYCDEETSGNSRCYDGNCLVMQDGETCDLAADFDFQISSTTESNLNTLSLYPNCGDIEYIGPDAFYFVELNTGNYKISLTTSSSEFDPALLILNGCDPINCIAYSNSSGPGLGEVLSLSVPSETTDNNSYVVVIDSTGTAGTYELRIELIEPDGDLDLDDDFDLEPDNFDIEDDWLEFEEEFDQIDQHEEPIDGDFDSIDIDPDQEKEPDTTVDGDMDEEDLEQDSIDRDTLDEDADPDFMDNDDDLNTDADENSIDRDHSHTDADIPIVDGDETSCEPGTKGCECYGNDTCNNGLVCMNGQCEDDFGNGDGDYVGCQSSTGGDNEFFFLLVLLIILLYRRRMSHIH